MDKRRKPAIREPRPHLTMEEMRSYLTSLREIESVTGIRYIKLHVTAKMIIGIREASGKEFTINLDDLFRAYNECLRFTSPEVKKYIFINSRGENCSRVVPASKDGKSSSSEPLPYESVGENPGMFIRHTIRN